MIPFQSLQRGSVHGTLKAQSDGHPDSAGDQQGGSPLPAGCRRHVRAQHLDEVPGFHGRLLCRTSFDSALRPRCTDTLMADSDIAVCAAASLTLSPCNLTNSMALR